MLIRESPVPGVFGFTLISRSQDRTGPSPTAQDIAYAKIYSRRQ